MIASFPGPRGGLGTRRGLYMHDNNVSVSRPPAEEVCGLPYMEYKRAVFKASI